MKTVIDSSTLISLVKINYLEIILKLKATLLIPNEVYEESVVEGEKKDMPDATVIKWFIADNKIPVIRPKSSSIKILFSKINKVLPEGDRAILALAIQEKAIEIMTDDEGLSKIAVSLTFKVTAYWEFQMELDKTPAHSQG